MSLDPAPRQCLVTLDVEGVLTPEIWHALAAEFAVPELNRTTKDEPDYAKLMQGRIDLLTEHDITIDRIQKVIADLSPMDGARDFLDQLRDEMQVVLLSDTFEQFIGPLMVQLGQPTILCHHLDIVEGRITSFTPRIENQKKAAVESFRAMNFGVISVGDSYNDLKMLDAAHVGFLFKAPEGIKQERADLLALETYDELTESILAARSVLLRGSQP